MYRMAVDGGDRPLEITGLTKRAYLPVTRKVNYVCGVCLHNLAILVCSAVERRVVSEARGTSRVYSSLLYIVPGPPANTILIFQWPDRSPAGRCARDDVISVRIPTHIRVRVTNESQRTRREGEGSCEKGETLSRVGTDPEPGAGASVYSGSLPAPGMHPAHTFKRLRGQLWGRLKGFP